MKFFHLHRKNVSNIQESTRRSEYLLRKYATSSWDYLLKEIDTTVEGLTVKVAEERLEENGSNKITISNHNTTGRRLQEAIINPFNIVLLVIAIITFVTDVVISKSGDYLTVIIILVLVGVSSLVAFIQGERSNAAAENLAKMISNKVDVYRDNQLIEIDLEEVVVGDLIKLSAGDMVPADVRFLNTKDTFIAQAALTGESNPIEKFSELKNPDADSLTDVSVLGFMGSNVVSGSATAIALATGNQTYFGSMAKTLSGDRAKNSFERGVDSVSTLLIRFMLILVPIIFLINGLIKGDWLNSLLFAITIAVGLTPEMLPVIMTSTLAKGAVTMSKKKVIVKTLGAIQTFGEMDILCTDKTGTLTEDKIVLEKYMNTHGEEDTRILRHAYLNSYFQTGLKNLIDLAIINRATESGLESSLENYTRVDEIPFDFARRRMSVVLVDKEGKRQLITKGAVDEIISICAYAEYNGKIYPMDEALKQDAYRIYEENNQDGLRMIAIAQKNNVADVHEFSVKDESEMVLIGFIGFLDPPKESAKNAIAALHEHGVRVVVLTGDSQGVALKVCGKVGVTSELYLQGKDVEVMSDDELENAVESCNLFSKLSPSQKQRVVEAFQKKGHTVGYMGDGINDAPPLHQADVGISVDSAVDIAKETADIILLEKDLMVLEEGVIEGRKTFGNITKYIKMATSGNLGNMISVIVASIFLPFFPMLPVHILAQNLLCDFSQMGIPFDNVDAEYLKKPQKWETKSIESFMIGLGPLSSLFDILCFLVLWFIIGANTMELAPVFQCGWFVFGTISQIVVVHMIRTAKVPFLQSNASAPLYISSILVIVIVLIIGFTNLSIALDLQALPLHYMIWLGILVIGYCIATQLMKILYIKKFKEWI